MVFMTVEDASPPPSGTAGTRESKPTRDVVTRLERPWFESPFFDRLLPQRDLAPEAAEQARRLHEDGFLILPDAFPEEVVDRARAEVEPLFAPQGEGSGEAPGRIHDAWRDCPTVRRIASDPTVLGLLHELYGRRPIPFQTLSFQFGSEQRPHADTIHFNSLPPRFMCGVWVALEDVDANNGSLVYYPGSHRLPDLDCDDLGLRLLNPNRSGPLDVLTYEDYDLYEDLVEELLEAHGLEPVTLEVKKGTALVWSAGLVHGGGEILVPGRTRWSQVIHCFFEGCLFYQPILSNRVTGDWYLKKITDIASGRIVPSTYRGIEVPEEAGDDILKLILDVETSGDGDERDILRALTNPQLKSLLRVREELVRAATELQEARRAHEAHLAAIERSPSFRLGRLLTAPVRWLRR